MNRDMLKQIWNICCNLFLLLGVLLGFFACVELFRVFVMFYRFHPLLGWGFCGTVLLLFIIVGLRLCREFRTIPKVLKAPLLSSLDQAGHMEMNQFCRYLIRYLERLKTNPNLEEEDRLRASERARDIKDVLSAHPLNEDLAHIITKTDEQTICPLLDALHVKASKEVRACVRDVMLGVTLSPYRSFDLILVLYRNATMVLCIAKIYRGKPHLHEQFSILRDTLKIVATVNFLNLGRNLIESLFANVPVIGRTIDDIGQGVGAGFLTSAAGHAAIERCAAYRGWIRSQAAEHVAEQAKVFWEDVRNLFIKDVFPELRGKILYSVEPEKAREPGFWDTLTKGISGAIDQTGSLLDSFIVRPAVAGTRGVVKAAGVVKKSVTGDHR